MTKDLKSRKVRTSMSALSTAVRSVGSPARAARASSLAFPAVPPAMEMSSKVVDENTAAEARVARRESRAIDLIFKIKSGYMVGIRECIWSDY